MLYIVVILNGREVIEAKPLRADSDALALSQAVARCEDTPGADGAVVWRDGRKVHEYTRRNVTRPRRVGDRSPIVPQRRMAGKFR